MSKESKTNKERQIKGEKIEKKKIVRNANICDLPPEILVKIITNLDTYSWIKVRQSCKRLKNICDEVFIHEFKKILKKYKQKNDPLAEGDGNDYFTLKAIYQATLPYLRAGYNSLFLAKLISQGKKKFRNSPSPSLEMTKYIISKYYHKVNEDCGNPFSQKLRLLYLITIFGILNECKNSILVTSTQINDSNWRVIYSLNGSWLGLLWSGTPPDLNYTVDECDLLLVLTEIMIFANREKSFQKVWEGRNKIFVFGHSESKKIRTPKTIFTFDIFGSERMFTFIKNAVQNEVWNILPDDVFSVTLHILSNEAKKWGANNDYSLEF